MDRKELWFQIPRSGFLDLLVKFNHEFHGEEESKKISIQQAYEFIDSFTKERFMDYDKTLNDLDI